MIDVLGMKPADCYRCDEIKKWLKASEHELEYAMKEYKSRKMYLEMVEEAKRDYINADAGSKSDYLRDLKMVEHWLRQHRAFHHQSLSLIAYWVEYYSKEVEKYSVEYVECYNKNKCGRCRRWYCDTGSGLIGAGSDFLSLVLAGSHVGLPGAFVTYGVSITNDIVTAKVCEEKEAATFAGLLDTSSIAFTVMTLGKAAAVVDAYSLIVNLGNVVN